MCVRLRLSDVRVCVHLRASVTKSWPGFRRTESHRLGSPLDGQGLARGLRGSFTPQHTHSLPGLNALPPRSSPALA